MQSITLADIANAKKLKESLNKIVEEFNTKAEELQEIIDSVPEEVWRQEEVEQLITNKADIFFTTKKYTFSTIKVGDNLRGKTITIDRTVTVDTGYPFELRDNVFLLSFSNGWGISFDGLYNSYSFEGHAYNQMGDNGGSFWADGAGLLFCEYGNYTCRGLLGGADSVGAPWSWATEDFTFPDDQDYIVSSINLPESTVWDGLAIAGEPINVDCEYNYNAIQDIKETTDTLASDGAKYTAVFTRDSTKLVTLTEYGDSTYMNRKYGPIPVGAEMIIPSGAGFIANGCYSSGTMYIRKTSDDSVIGEITCTNAINPSYGSGIFKDLWCSCFTDAGGTLRGTFYKQLHYVFTEECYLHFTTSDDDFNCTDAFVILKP